MTNLVKLSKLQATIIGAYTGIICGPFEDIHAYAEDKLDRPIWSHEFADPVVAEQIKQAAKDDFISICAD